MLHGMATIPCDEFEQLRLARQQYFANAGYTTAAEANLFIAAIRQMIAFPEQVTLPGGESFRSNHAELRQMLVQAQKDRAKLSAGNASGAAVYLQPYLRR